MLQNVTSAGAHWMIWRNQYKHVATIEGATSTKPITALAESPLEGLASFSAFSHSFFIAP